MSNAARLRLPMFFGPFIVLLICGGLAPDLSANPLLDELGRNESRVFSAPFSIPVGADVGELSLDRRLERLGYRRVKARPGHPGQYFWGHDVFWIYRQAGRWDGREQRAKLFRLGLSEGEASGVIRTLEDAEGRPVKRIELEPELLWESLAADRAVRVPIRLADLPEHVWRPVLAAEDSRFFDHVGVDSRSVARALLANVKAGRVRQGGSTLTQQLIKNRDLSPKRSLGRKASEAMRALALEAVYDKKDILEAYLDTVYLGHVDGLAIHGLGTAAHVFFGRPAEKLTLAQSSLLAAMIQGPNRLSPKDDRPAVEKRRRWVLDRLVELGWVTFEQADEAELDGARLARRRPQVPLGSSMASWIQAEAGASKRAAKRLKDQRGLVIWSGLDPLLQAAAEEEARRALLDLNRKHRFLRQAPVSLALVTLDARDGRVLAAVTGNPVRRSGLDHVRRARRQPGSTVKPLVLLEAFERCGRRDPVYPARRVRDEPLEVALPSGPWKPVNSDGEFRGVVSLRQALRRSLNVPFARLGQWCGADAVGERFRRLGLDTPQDPPPSLVLGALEVSPLDLAAAYGAIADGGLKRSARLVRHMEQPNGRPLERWRKLRGRRSKARRVVGEDTAYLVHDLMVDAAQKGSAQSAQPAGVTVAAKTGTSSQKRDAWLAGYSGSLVTVVWIGRDDGRPLGLTGAQAAAPLWRQYMARATEVYPTPERRRPSGVVERRFDPRTGLLVGPFNSRAESELFRRGALPTRKRLWREETANPPIR